MYNVYYDFCPEFFILCIRSLRACLPSVILFICLHVGGVISNVAFCCVQYTWWHPCIYIHILMLLATVCNATSGVCECSPGFTGISCGQLDLLPVSSETNYGRVWPQKAAGTGVASWGFSAVKGSDEQFHAIVNVSCGKLTQFSFPHLCALTLATAETKKCICTHDRHYYMFLIILLTICQCI